MSFGVQDVPNKGCVRSLSGRMAIYVTGNYVTIMYLLDQDSVTSLEKIMMNQQSVVNNL